MFLRVKKTSGYKYLQIVESKREGVRIRQRVIGTIGRIDELQERGQIDQLLKSLAKYSERALLLLAGSSDPEAESKKVGPVLIFERLWKRLGIGEHIAGLLLKQRYRFKVERAVFVTVLHRLMCSGSDRQAERWQQGYKIDGAEKIQLHHLYRAMAWLGNPLSEAEDMDSDGKAPRCIKDKIEENIFNQRRDIFTGMDLVFFDTTSIYFEGHGGETIGQRGHSKDSRSDLRQMVVGMVIDAEGYPVCCEIWPGNTTDVKSLMVVVRRLKKRFGIERICVVADRGMISLQTIEDLETESLQYILGVRMRNHKDIIRKLLTEGTYETVYAHRIHRHDPSPLSVKEVQVEGCRYIICDNPEEAKADAEIRKQIIETLRKKLKSGNKELVGNKGYRRYLSTVKGCHFIIDEKKVKEEAMYDGKWILTTNTKLAPREVALKYKQLWMVERIFRDMKTILQSRPIFHKCDETIRGHVFCSFLALLLRKELDMALEHAGQRLEWEDIKTDLKALQETRIEENGKRISVRSRIQGCCGKVFAAVGVALPPTLKVT